MKRFFAVSKIVGLITIGVALFLGMFSSPAFAQRTESVFNGHRIIIPESSIPQPGRHHTNYFFVDSDAPDQSGPPSGVETPGSVACVYQLVSGPAAQPIWHPPSLRHISHPGPPPAAWARHWAARSSTMSASRGWGPSGAATR